MSFWVFLCHFVFLLEQCLSLSETELLLLSMTSFTELPYPYNAILVTMIFIREVLIQHQSVSPTKFLSFAHKPIDKERWTSGSLVFSCYSLICLQLPFFPLSTLGVFLWHGSSTNLLLDFMNSLTKHTLWLYEFSWHHLVG